MPRAARHNGPGAGGRARRSKVRRAGCAAAVLLACCVPPWFVSGPVGYAPLGIALATMAISYGYLRHICAHIAGTQEVSLYSCARGEGEDVSIGVANTSRLVVARVEPTFEVADDAGGEPQTVRARAALAPHETRPFALGVTLDHVGFYEIGMRSAEVFDLLGLFSRPVAFDQTCRVRVVPRVWRLDGLGTSELTTSDAHRSVRTVLSDDMDYASVRDYRLGDPMKTVHWKMSARVDDHLYTKLFESHTNPGTAVVLDFHSTETDPETRSCLYDAMLEAAFSIVDHARRRNVRTTLAFVDRLGVATSTPDNDTDRLGLLLDRMPRLGADVATGSAADLARGLLGDPDSQANVVLVTSHLGDEIVEAAVALRHARRGVRVICAVAQSMSDRGRRELLAPSMRLEQAQVPFATIECGEDIREAVGSW